MRITRTIFLSAYSAVRIILLLTSLASCYLSDAQVDEDFTDGDFTVNPTWTGDTSDFIVSYSSAVPQSMKPALKLNSSGSDTSCLVVNSLLAGPAEWQFWIKLSFNTSANNFIRVYLGTDQADLKGNLNGYFIQIGGANDSLGLFKQSGTQIESLIRGMHVFTGNSTNEIRVKISCDAEGKWAIFADQTGGFNFLPEGECIENSMEGSAYLGIYCKYTSSNSSNFYFDDLYAGALEVDTVPPELEKVEIISASVLRLMFSENIHAATAENPANYFIDNGIGHAVSASLEMNALNQVVVEFSAFFDEGVGYTVEIENISDYSGNINNYQAKSFLFQLPHIVQPHEIVINEIMPDIHPAPQGLPAMEYLELFNASSSPVNTADLWLRLRPDADRDVLPEFTIEANDYLILTDVDDVEYFLTYGQVAGQENFYLDNSGSIELSDASGQVIHLMEYNSSHYGNDMKSEGGWALEQIDPYNPCLGMENWLASLSPDGGSPGRINSVNADNSLPISIRKTIVKSDTALLVEFNQAIQDLHLIGTDVFEVDRGIGNPNCIFPLDSSYRVFMLNFDQLFLPARIYQISATQFISNCAGVSASMPGPFSFGVAENALKCDVVINEVLYNPAGDGVDFIELYNRSEKIINLKNLQLGSVTADQFGVFDTSYKAISTEDHLLLTDAFVVLTRNPEKIQQQYFTGAADRFIQMESFPSFNNESGIAVVSNMNGQRIDRMNYSASQHHPLLTSEEGVSLERIHPDRSSTDPFNWHSASSLSGYATPALINSQYAEPGEEKKELFIEPPVFSPDNDGYQDYVDIRYHLPSSGYAASIVIYDANGRLVRYLVNNELLGQQGSVIWDGCMEDRSKAALGIYIVYFEAFNPSGDVKKIKKVVVVAGRLD